MLYFGALICKSVYKMWEKVYRDCLAALGGDLQIDTLIIVLILTLVFFSGYAHVVFEDADRRHLESRILHKDATEPEVRRGQGPGHGETAEGNAVGAVELQPEASTPQWRSVQGRPPRPKPEDRAFG